MRAGHPDKLCDQIADAILDRFLDVARANGVSAEHARRQRAGIEVLAKDNTVVLAGEVRLLDGVVPEIDYEKIVGGIFQKVGYDSSTISVVNLIGMQQPELQASSDRQGAGDQGVMIGYATSETSEQVPLEHKLATEICRMLDSKLGTPDFEWLRPDGKAQVTIGPNNKVTKIVVGAQHAESVNGSVDPMEIQDFVKAFVLEHILLPTLGEKALAASIVVNGTGSFAIGGPTGDAGVCGRKIVCDAYGPRIPVGGGAFSGKDPTKVDRTGAYMARYVARSALEAHGDASSVTVRIAFAIGNHHPEMVSATDSNGRDLSGWVTRSFPDLSPMAMQEILDLWRLRDDSWSYLECARYGHFGRSHFPWERSILLGSPAV